MRCIWCLLLLTLNGHAQTSQILYGTWEGIHKMEQVKDSAVIRITINQVSGQTFTGISSGHLFRQPQQNYYHGRIKGKITGDTVTINILPPDDSRLKAYPGFQWCTGNSVLLLQKDGNKYSLAGQVNADDCLTHPARLIKQSTTLKYTARENVLVETIALKDRHFRIALYDNGTVDSDTVSVYFNQQLVAGQQRLQGKAQEFQLEASETGDNELIMYAENEGDIPPNTALMVIYADNKIHRVQLKAGYTRNAVVRFILISKK